MTPSGASTSGRSGRTRCARRCARRSGELPDRPFGDALEIGAGTGYFSLNLLQLGMVERITATDISPGMLATLSASAERLGVEAETVRTEAEELPFEDESFDLVLGHAVLHHIPDLRRGPSPSSAASCARAGRLSSAASRPATATALPRSPSAPR